MWESLNTAILKGVGHFPLCGCVGMCVLRVSGYTVYCHGSQQFSVVFEDRHKDLLTLSDQTW